jgi:hypothetical protein
MRGEQVSFADPPEAERWGGMLFQQAWVTNDLERAMGVLGSMLGVAEFEQVEDRRLVVDTPVGKRELLQRLAFGQAGAMMIEVIQPVGDDQGFWSEGLPSDRFAIKQHHLSVRIDGPRPAWEAYRMRIRRAAALPVEGVFGRSHFLFADVRDTLGCYLEAVWRAPRTDQ